MELFSLSRGSSHRHVDIFYYTILLQLLLLRCSEVGGQQPNEQSKSCTYTQHVSTYLFKLFEHLQTYSRYRRYLQLFLLLLLQRVRARIRVRVRIGNRIRVRVTVRVKGLGLGLGLGLRLGLGLGLRLRLGLGLGFNSVLKLLAFVFISEFVVGVGGF